MVTGSDGVDNYGSQITSFERWIVWCGGVFDHQIDVHTGTNTVLARGGDDFVTYATGAANGLDGLPGATACGSSSTTGSVPWC